MGSRDAYGLPEALRTEEMEFQRCVWQGLHDFRDNLFQDGVKGSAPEPYREGKRSHPQFHYETGGL